MTLFFVGLGLGIVLGMLLLAGLFWLAVCYMANEGWD